MPKEILLYTLTSGDAVLDSSPKVTLNKVQKWAKVNNVKPKETTWEFIQESIGICYEKGIGVFFFFEKIKEGDS